MRYKYEKAKFDDVPDPFKERKNGVTALLAGTALAGGAIIVYGGLVIAAGLAIGGGGNLGGGGGHHGSSGGGNVVIFTDPLGLGVHSSGNGRSSEDLGDRSRILKYEPLSNGLKKIVKGGVTFLLGAHNEKVRQTKYLETHDEKTYHRELAEQKEKNKILEAISKETIGCIKAKHTNLSRYYNSECLDTIIRNTVKQSQVDVLNLREGTALSAFAENLADKLVAQSPQLPANSRGKIKWLDPDLSTDRNKLSEKDAARSLRAQEIVSAVVRQLGGNRSQPRASQSTFSGRSEVPQASPYSQPRVQSGGGSEGRQAYPVSGKPNSQVLGGNIQHIPPTQGKGNCRY